MRLTSFTDYALRVLVYLAVHGDRRPTIREISERYGISRNHLMKVVSLLTRDGFVLATRGPGGGLELARSPRRIGVGDVVRRTEDDLALVECFREDDQCAITPACRLKNVLGEALKAFLEVLDQYTLADLVEDRVAALRVLLPPE